jgi:hypothetical protein
VNIFVKKGLFGGSVMRLSKSVFRTRRILVLFVMLMSLRAPIHGMAQTAEAFSDIDSALQAIRQTFHVSTGFETAVGDVDKAPIMLDLSGNSVARVFDSLVKQRPNYVWSLRDSFYDVHPTMKAQSFSQVSVANYLVRDATLKEAVDAIEKLPEIKRWLAHHHQRRQNLISVTRAGPPPPQERRSLALKDIQVRSILNQVYGSFGETQWAIWHQGQDIGMSFSF